MSPCLHERLSFGKEMVKVRLPTASPLRKITQVSGRG